MEVLLRTASTLARACSETAQRIEVRAVARITVSQRAALIERLERLSDETYAHMQDVTELHWARAEIRRLIGEANQQKVHPLLVERDTLNTVEKFISEQLEQMQAVSRRRRLYGDTGSLPVAHNFEEVNSALVVVQQRLDTVTHGDVPDYVEVVALSPDQVTLLQDRLSALRRRRAALSDELAAANLNARITLPSSVLATLRKHKIIE